MLKIGFLINSIRYFSSQSTIPNICIVGAGPAGFYATQQILKSIGNVKVDIIERLPVPYGLVRFGVAPDHSEVKNVINTFAKIAKDKRVQFLGNINVGCNISIEELRQHYHAVLLTYGAEEDKTLDIPGENLKNVISAKSFVGWYNGNPKEKDLDINLNTEDAVILGQGNVAIDVARILLSPIDKLKNTDITCYSLEKLAESNIKRVWLVGRRGPLQAAFTIAELREMLKLENCKTYWRTDDFKGIKEIICDLARPRKRLTELMLKSIEDAKVDNRECLKEFHPIFLRGPVEFSGLNSVEKIKFSVNELQGQDLLNQIAKSSTTVEEISTGLAVKSIGYKSIPIDSNIPFDLRNGRILNASGKVEDGLYAAGWVATGPVGVILSTMTNAFKVGQLLSKELDCTHKRDGYEQLKNIFQQRGLCPITFEGWEQIDKEECARGKKLGKPREKIVDISEMIEIAQVEIP
ncbi:NADPH:adrenodoxin oxidoreductase, mitochondrial isoform X7 [Phymastichus coffea]|uniref:NADPH:adrenodoxin oxidoreductase, mitochondrial isoform X7 n=1 Tax=Phymastichus coffea TaxID=108790 RepID=UPI00273CDD4E|nr:NADPH:adrenodoxin oxidoreductase, mitochondrial isoform X7 [Phymastichus coffea]XP_058803424.1 NADPH:adrenodoxin oxidoreductase, mitochondrial isoform X7 [Phymastichus coffea]